MLNHPNVIVIGRSGSGKSYSLRNLNPKTTRILNIERKALPFKHSYEFDKNDNNIYLEEHGKFFTQLKKAIDNPDLEVIVVESGIKLAEVLLKTAKEIKKGYDIYNMFNDKVGEFLELIKENKGKIIIVLWIDELVKEISPTGTESTCRRAAISGKVWEGKIEKEFTICLFTDVRQEKGKDAVHGFLTNNDGTHSAKSPPDLFNKQYIDNDLAMVVEKIKEYYGLEKEIPQEVPFDQ